MYTGDRRRRPRGLAWFSVLLAALLVAHMWAHIVQRTHHHHHVGSSTCIEGQDHQGNGGHRDGMIHGEAFGAPTGSSVMLKQPAALPAFTVVTTLRVIPILRQAPCRSPCSHRARAIETHTLEVCRP